MAKCSSFIPSVEENRYHVYSFMPGVEGTLDNMANVWKDKMMSIMKKWEHEIVSYVYECMRREEKFLTGVFHFKDAMYLDYYGERDESKREKLLCCLFRDIQVMYEKQAIEIIFSKGEDNPSFPDKFQLMYEVSRGQE